MAANIGIHTRDLLKSEASWPPFILRVVLALVIFPHGAQKLFGVFGGFGFEGTMQYFTEVIGMPYVLGLVVILLETAGTLSLIFGLGVRLLAVAYTILALGILLSSHIEHGFFMNWYGNQAGEGMEYFLLWLAISTSLFITGAGKYSLDNYLYQKGTP